MTLEWSRAGALGIYGGGQQGLAVEVVCLRKGEMELEGGRVEGVHLAELGGRD